MNQPTGWHTHFHLMVAHIVLVGVSVIVGFVVFHQSQPSQERALDDTADDEKNQQSYDPTLPEGGTALEGRSTGITLVLAGAEHEQLPPVAVLIA
jgi:hypothetical protein